MQAGEYAFVDDPLVAPLELLIGPCRCGNCVVFAVSKEIERAVLRSASDTLNEVLRKLGTKIKALPLADDRALSLQAPFNRLWRAVLVVFDVRNALAHSVEPDAVAFETLTVDTLRAEAAAARRDPFDQRLLCALGREPATTTREIFLKCLDVLIAAARQMNFGLEFGRALIFDGRGLASRLTVLRGFM